MLVFTSCINNYIPKARILAESLKKFHPEWEFCLLLGETPPKNFKLENEPFDRLLLFSDLHIPNYNAWLFRHRVVEICTAAKGPALYYFLNIEKNKKVIYLDPDIMVFNYLNEIDNLLDIYDILLTPHQTCPQSTYKSIVDNEICSLKHGIFNLGFIAVANREQGIKFSQWWRDRLYLFCYDDIPNGLFTDQRWCDMIPAFFSNYKILREPGYNVATWNLCDRTVTQNYEGIFLVNGKPLYFYHFTGYDSGAGRTMLDIYGKNMPVVKKLWDLYENKLEQNDHIRLKKLQWKNLFFDDGTLVNDQMRLFYRNNPELQNKFPNPFQKNIKDSYYTYYKYNKFNLKSIIKIKSLLKFLYKFTTNNNISLYRTFKKAIIVFNNEGIKGLINKFKNKYKLLHSEEHLSIEINQLHNNVQYYDIKNYIQENFSRSKESILIIDHQYGGGAGAYIEQKISDLTDNKVNIIRLTWDILKKFINITIYIRDKTFYFKCNSLQDIVSLDWLFISKIIINELVTWNKITTKGKQYNKYDSIAALLEEIKYLAKSKNANIEILIHDFFYICPQYTLLNYNNNYCGIPNNTKACKSCLLNLNIGISSDFSIETWRKNWQELFNISDSIIFFSNSSYKILKQVYDIQRAKIKIIPHKPLENWNKYQYAIPMDTPMTIGVIGSISKHKGAQIIADMIPLLDKDEKIIIIGDLQDVIIKSNKLIIHGKYNLKDLPKLLEKYKITIGFIPSICPETFNYTSQECVQLGLPTVAFHIGEQGERIGNWDKGMLAMQCTAESAYEALHKLDKKRLEI